MNIEGKQPNSFHIARSNGKKDQIYNDRNKRSVWTVPTKPYAEAHFATFPEELITPCILAGCPQGGIVLDPFMGAGTSALVALKQNKRFIGFELKSEYLEIANKRIHPYLTQTRL